MGAGRPPPRAASPRWSCSTSGSPSYEQDLADERAARWRIEVAQAKNLSAEQAAWLQRRHPRRTARLSRPAARRVPAAPAGPRTPAPDPSQGARGGQPGPDLQAQIAAAKAKGDIKTAIALERSKLSAIPRPS
jgi:hypothetical protein